MTSFHGIKWLSGRIVGPGIPDVGQERFGAELRRLCGCGLAWHHARRVFVVFRDAAGSRPTFYPTELGRRHFPLSTAILGLVVDAVRLADGFAERDASKAMDVFLRRQKDMEDSARASMLADMMPDFVDNMQRSLRMLREGRRARARTIVDLAPAGT